MSAAEIRRNGNTTSLPEPVIPSGFVINLYAPDQEVYVRQRPGSWGGSGYWEFELPQHTFRQPSVSDLDRSQTDPASTVTTPKINFRWKRDGKLSKDLVCLLSGKSNDPIGLKKKTGSREPDIAIALFRHLKEITVYEPNLSRVDIEDPKGLEIVLLLSGAVIRDVFFGNAREVFNLSTTPRRESADKNSNMSSARAESTSRSQLQTEGPCLSGASIHSQTRLPPGRQSPQQPHPYSGNPATSGPYFKSGSSPSQLEIDNETARLRALVEAEERSRARTERAETKRIRKMLEAEERDARRRQAEIDQESERLKKIYGEEQNKALRKSKKHSPAPQEVPVQSLSQSTTMSQGPFSGGHGVLGQDGPYARLQPYRSPSPLHAQTGSRPPARGYGPSRDNRSGVGRDPQLEEGRRTAAKKKKSMFGLRSQSDETGIKLSKKRSSIF